MATENKKMKLSSNSFNLETPTKKGRFFNV